METSDLFLQLLECLVVRKLSLLEDTRSSVIRRSREDANATELEDILWEKRIDCVVFNTFVEYLY